MNKPKASVVIALALLFSGAGALGRQNPPPTVGAAAPPVAAPAGASPAGRRREAFEVVWRTVKEQHFDPAFGGVDWEAVGREFRPLASRARTDAELHRLLQTMLNRLGQSHFNVIPPESIPEFVDGGEDAEGEGEKGEEGKGEGGAEDEVLQLHKLGLTEHLTHGVGLDLRLIGGSAVLTRVEPGSPAERAGLRPGFVLRSVDGRPVRSLLRALRRAALYDPAARHQLSAQFVVGFLNGPPGTGVRLTYLDARDRPRSALLARERLKGEMSPPLRNLPPQFVEFEAKRLRGGVGYVRFNVFAAPVMEKFCAAVRSMSDAPGLVVDLRGNRGGVLALLYGMGGLLSDRPLSLGEMRTREGGWLFNVTPQRRAYAGQLVLLIDGQTQSAGEMFAAGLSEMGRALTVGERSAGATLPSAVRELPTGALLQYAFADYRTPYGRTVEGLGVEPTVRVRLDRRSLLAGRDPQLEAALDAFAPAVNGGPRAAADAASGGLTAEDESLVSEERGEEEAERKEAGEEKREGNAGEQGRAADGRDPAVERILERYERAVGGREAFAKIESRVTEGKVEGAFAGAGVDGSFETYEKLPDRTLSVIRLGEVGRLRRAYTGAYGYEQATLYGFRELRGEELAALRAEADPRWPVRLRELYPRMTYRGAHEVEGAPAEVVEAAPARGRPTVLFFDKATGLLVRRDGFAYEDYRKVDGVLLPFLLRSPQMTMRLTRVRHNVPVPDETFAEEPDCFTR